MFINSCEPRDFCKPRCMTNDLHLPTRARHLQPWQICLRGWQDSLSCLDHRGCESKQSSPCRPCSPAANDHCTFLPSFRSRYFSQFLIPPPSKKKNIMLNMLLTQKINIGSVFVEDMKKKKQICWVFFSSPDQVMNKICLNTRL